MKVFLKTILPSYCLGLVTCYLLTKELRLHPVLASCLSTFPVALIPIKKFPQIKEVFYCGTFAGMTSLTFLDSWGVIFLSSILGATLYYLIQDRFLGIGGKLGFISFLNIGFLTLMRRTWLFFLP